MTKNKVRPIAMGFIVPQLRKKQSAFCVCARIGVSLKGWKTQSCSQFFDGDGRSSTATGNGAGDEICGRAVNARVPGLADLLRVEEHGNIVESISQSAACEKVRKVLKGFISGLIWE